MLSISRFAALAFLPLLLFAPLSSAQQTPPEPPHDHAHMEMSKPPAAAPSAPASDLTLDAALRTAAQANPALRQADLQVRAAKSRVQQAALYPNPTLGYVGDEIRGGSTGGGKQGFTLDQTIVTGGKLSKARSVQEQELRLAELQAEAQKTRIENGVRIAFYRVLAAQQLLALRRNIVENARESLRTQTQLQNSGQADESELLFGEAEVHRLQVLSNFQEVSLRRQWRTLATLMGEPDLPLATLQGSLEDNLPQLDESEVARHILAHSPAALATDALIARAQARLDLSRSAATPDLLLRAGLEYNNELMEGTNRATGWEGIAGLSIALPVFNRNQGNVAAAGADLESARLEKQRVALLLSSAAQSWLDEFSTARLSASEYRDVILPRARKAVSLLTEKNSLMLASLPHVQEATRKLYDLQLEYVRTLESVWTTGIALQGFLLADGLDLPAPPSPSSFLNSPPPPEMPALP